MHTMYIIMIYIEHFIIKIANTDNNYHSLFYLVCM